MKVTLIVDGGRYHGKEIAIAMQEVKIGRDEKCNIQLDSEDVSRVHCTLLIMENEVTLRDEKSSNGTFVNRRRLRGELQLEDGDSIQVGPQLFNIVIETPLKDNDEEEADSVFTTPDNPADASATLISRIPVIDPGDLAAAEKARLRERLKNIEPNK